jgi:DnaJ-class molecular chaperone
MRGLIALVLLLLGLYAITCAVMPWGQCHKCHGDKRIPTRSGRGRARKCPRCRGTGIRLRLGRRVFNYFSDVKGQAEAK